MREEEEEGRGGRRRAGMGGREAEGGGGGGRSASGDARAGGGGQSRHRARLRSGWLIYAVLPPPPPPPSHCPPSPRRLASRKYSKKSKCRARRKMGSGSSSYRPKAIYLDIDGRIQKVAPAPPAVAGRPPARAPRRASPPRGPLPRVAARRVSARVGGPGQGTPAGVGGDHRACVRGSGLRPPTTSVAGGGALRGRCPPAAAPSGKGDVHGGNFSFRGQSCLCNKSDWAEFVRSEAATLSLSFPAGRPQEQTPRSRWAALRDGVPAQGRCPIKLSRRGRRGAGGGGGGADTAGGAPRHVPGSAPVPAGGQF